MVPGGSRREKKRGRSAGSARRRRGASAFILDVRARGSAAWRGRTGWRGPGWANPVPGRWPGRAGGAWPAASHTAGAGQGRGESREKRERIRGLIQNSNFSQRFFLKHEKL